MSEQIHAFGEDGALSPGAVLALDPYATKSFVNQSLVPLSERLDDLESGTSDPGGTTDHAALINRDAEDQHPISAITNLQVALNHKAEFGHLHTIDDVEYLQSALNNKAEAGHTHDDRYYTESEINTALEGKANTSHSHSVTDLTATGTPSATTYLRGDGAWATPEGGGGGGGGSSFELRGTGMPNGAVTANPGTYYTDTAGTNGAWRWLKTSGTGNTGWVIIHGDTGPRNVNGLLTANFEPWGPVILQQTADSVNLAVDTYAAGSLSGQTLMLTLPAGFGQPQTAFAATTLGASGLLVISESRAVQFHGTAAPEERIRASLSWPRGLLWPTTLPGVPA